MISKPKKRGQLSLEEEQFIKDHVSSSSPEIIAASLNRNVSPITRYIVEAKLLVDESEKKQDEILKQKLYSKTFWNEIKRQFDEDSGELDYFEKTRNILLNRGYKLLFPNNLMKASTVS